jgi:hypothetical protein
MRKRPTIIIILSLIGMYLLFWAINTNSNIYWLSVITYTIGLWGFSAWYFGYIPLLQDPPEVKHEYILCSAIWFDDGKEHPHQPLNIKTGVVYCGYRHHNIFAMGSVSEDIRNWNTEYEREQGFLTSQNRFVDRQEAFKIADNAGQLTDRKTQNNHTLYSEDLY